MAGREYRTYHRSIDEITHKRKPLREILEAHQAWFGSGYKKGCRADLSEADLIGANLSTINLMHADLRGANLLRADLRWADLGGADLTKANLIWANLTAARLDGVRVGQVKMGETIIANCDLSDVVEMEAVLHEAPSSIGVDTILKSKGRIPDVFLRGAGLPDVWIEYARSLVTNPIEFYSCFISHSSQDKDFCDRLYANLQAKSVRCWYFPEDATWGKSVWGEIDRGIRIYDKLVVVCSEHSLNSGPVIREIERALQREDQEKREILFPIRIDNYLFEKWDHPRKADVVAKVVGDFRTWKDHEQYKKNFDKLLKALNHKQADRS